MVNSKKFLFFILLLGEVTLFSAAEENLENRDTRGEHKRWLFEKFRGPKPERMSPQARPRSEKKSVSRANALLTFLVQDIVEAQLEIKERRN